MTATKARDLVAGDRVIWNGPGRWSGVVLESSADGLVVQWAGLGVQRHRQRLELIELAASDIDQVRR
jgi:hypothetical protein